MKPPSACRIVLLRAWRGRCVRVGALVAVALGALGLLPLFGRPGYEQALASGLLVPVVAALLAAHPPAHRRDGSPYDRVAWGLACGFGLGAVSLGVALLVGLFKGFCGFPQGLAWMALGPGVGALMAGVWGAWGGVICDGLTVGRGASAGRCFWAVLGPLAGIGISLWRFYASPMVFAFDPFFGYFAGPLYDTALDGLGRLATYRAGSLASLLAAMAGAACLERRQLRGKHRLRLRLRWRAYPLGVALLSLVASGGVAVAGERLGHRTSAATLTDALPRGARVGGCDVRYAPTIDDGEARLLAEDCAAALTRQRRWLGSGGTAAVRVYLFANSQQKGRLTGASTTSIAKPWRREVYLEHRPFPHPVLEHELAHVVAGEFAHGPFRVAGPVGGWWPDPGRIEGTAVAASEGYEGLQRDSASLLKIGLLPPLEELFALGFLARPARAAYAVAGAFVSWLVERQGNGVLRAWYAGGSLARLTGRGFSELEREWRDSLRRLPITRHDEERARRRFDRPAIFSRRCPRFVDELVALGQKRFAAGDIPGAQESYGRWGALEPGSLSPGLGTAACLLRRGRAGEAHELYERLLTVTAKTEFERLAVTESVADARLLAGELAVARGSYQRLEQQALDEPSLRRLQVKALACSGPVAAAAVKSLLLSDRVGAGWDDAVADLMHWSSSAPTRAVADYLLAKNWFQRGEHGRALRHVDEALARGGLTPELLREAWRVRFWAACALGRRAPALGAAGRLRRLAGEDASLAERVEEDERRCRGILEVSARSNGKILRD